MARTSLRCLTTLFRQSGQVSLKAMLTRLLVPAATTHTVSFALLLVRVWFGATMMLFHGWTKFASFASLSPGFPDPYGVGRPLSLALSIAAELVCAALLVAGLGTRPAALILGVNMVTAFVFGHGMKLTGPGNGELAFLYLGVCAALLVAGAGRYSLDSILFGRR